MGQKAIVRPTRLGENTENQDLKIGLLTWMHMHNTLRCDSISPNWPYQQCQSVHINSYDWKVVIRPKIRFCAVLGHFPPSTSHTPSEVLFTSMKMSYATKPHWPNLRHDPEIHLELSNDTWDPLEDMIWGTE